MHLLVILSLFVQVTVAFIGRVKNVDSSYSLNMFGKKNSISSSSSPEAIAAIRNFRRVEPKSELKDAALLKAFGEITTLFKGDKASALLCFKNQPKLFIYATRETKLMDDRSKNEIFKSMSGGFKSSLQTVKECFVIYENKFGFEKAVGLATRNPSLLSVRPTGYASAETAAGETIFVSYLIDASRGKGQYFLGVLALLLLSKPFGIHF